MVTISTNEMVDNVFILEPQFYSGTLGRYVVIHHSAEMSLEGGRVSKNFDVMVDFTHKGGDSLFTKMLGDQYVAVPRYPKYMQTVMLLNLKMEGLRVPKVFMNLGMGWGDRQVFVVPDVPKVVVKEVDGARGTNQVLLKSHLLNRFLKSKDKPLVELKRIFPDAVYTKTYSDEQEGFFTQDVFVQEYIPNVEEEFRLLVGGDSIYIRRRSTNVVENETGEAYKHANIDYTTFTSCEESNFYHFPKPDKKSSHLTLFCSEWGFTKEQIKLVWSLVKGLDITLGSIDLFTTTEGELGVFEWCHQFAFNNVDGVTIRNLHKSFIEHVIEKSGVLEDV